MKYQLVSLSSTVLLLDYGFKLTFSDCGSNILCKRKAYNTEVRQPAAARPPVDDALEICQYLPIVTHAYTICKIVL